MKDRPTILLDADILAFRVAAINQKTFKWDEEDTTDVSTSLASPDVWKANVDERIEAICETLKTSTLNLIVCLTSKPNWRNSILPSYKENRKDTVRPLLLQEIMQYLRDSYVTYERPLLEADDVMGILSTHPTLLVGRKIIVSEDKDMKTIPGWLYNPDKDASAYYITPQAADLYHLYQTLIGDTTDGYSGCPGVGKVKATKLLESFTDSTTPLEMWEAVVEVYASKGLTESDAIVQAQVARICRHTEYNFKTREVIPWRPH